MRTTSSTRNSSSSRSSATSTSSTSSTRAQLEELFEYTLGQRPPAFVTDELIEWEATTGIDVVRYALQETAAAPRPSWKYARAILQRCKGIQLPAPRPGLTLTQRIEIGRGALERKRKRDLATDDSTIIPFAE